MLGLSNWGINVIDKETESVSPLHGEASNIPVKDIKVTSEKNRLIVSGSIYTRTFEGDERNVWYERGEKLFKIKRKVTIVKDEPEILISDSLTNVSEITRTSSVMIF